MALLALSPSLVRHRRWPPPQAGPCARGPRMKLEGARAVLDQDKLTVARCVPSLSDRQIVNPPRMYGRMWCQCFGRSPTRRPARDRDSTPARNDAERSWRQTPSTTTRLRRRTLHSAMDTVAWAPSASPAHPTSLERRAQDSTRAIESSVSVVHFLIRDMTGCSKSQYCVKHLSK